MYNPFFTIITRTFCRPSKLAIGVQSIINQTCKDVEQILLIDKSGNHPEGNVLWANRQFAMCYDRIDGIYVIALDDDGVFVDNRHLDRVKQCAIENDFPEAILVKSYTLKNHNGDYHYLPSSDVWNCDWDLYERPIKWYGNGSNWVVRFDVFNAMATNYAKAPGGDWYFMTSLIESGISFVKCDSVGIKSMQRGKGKDFEECYGDYWIKALSRRFGLKQINPDDWRLQLWKSK